ncbi:hypothetical protein D3C72_1761500 [compost metagenome]
MGKPVVPEVYWMLMGSSNCRPAWRSASASTLTSPALPCRAAQGRKAAGGLAARLTTPRSSGRRSQFRLPGSAVASSGTRPRNMAW